QTETDLDQDQDRDRDQDQEEQEKQPMTGGGRAADSQSAGEDTEKNGSVKLKIPENPEEPKFTGLSKEELLRVAGTPGWVRTRWTLLLVFWLGWLGMLVGAVVIILHAPECRQLPDTKWWNEGPLYQIGHIQAFTASQDLKGETARQVDSLSQLKVKGLVVGPIHVAPPDEPVNLSFEEDRTAGGDSVPNTHVFCVLSGISVVLDLTPNYQGSSGPWFSNISVTNVAERLKVGQFFWSSGSLHVIHVSVLIWSVSVFSVWSGFLTNESVVFSRVLIGVTDRSSARDVSFLLASCGVDLLISRVLLAGEMDATERAQSIQHLYSSHNQTFLAWSLDGRSEGHLASLVGPALVKLHQLLLFTLPGTPVFNYGDEIGLMDMGTTFPRMLWDSKEELNGTRQEERTQRLSYRRFFCSLSELRVKARSLMFGDFLLLYNSSSSLAYLRAWDQSDRYLAAFNWAEEAAVLQLSDPTLPRRATVILSTNSSALPDNSSVDLTSLWLGPGQAALLMFPYAP
uniref:Solute carrier family 3 member 2b n=1 Tax=Echeneis naucrates TaxID=173247 RepID=A0A665U9E7_ECHNA